jgi:two-component sensor histidine kinase
MTERVMRSPDTTMTLPALTHTGIRTRMRGRVADRRVPVLRLDFLTQDEEPALMAEAGSEIDLRQLRHHTKNALQRILGLVNEAPGLLDTQSGADIVRRLERRIQVSAAISDALFGLTRAPAAMTERLRSLCANIVELMAEPAQILQVGVSVRGECPAHLREVVVRVTHELVGNAIKHGMRGRPRGRITVRMVTEADGSTQLSVTDDGNGFRASPRFGEGLTVARSLAERFGGSIGLRHDGQTTASLRVPAGATGRA